MCGQTDDPTQHDEETSMNATPDPAAAGYRQLRVGDVVVAVTRHVELDGSPTKLVDDPGSTILRVRLDWLVKVKGTTIPEDARAIVAEYLADQDLADQVEIDRPELGDADLSVILYPDDEEVPEHDELREATTWSTYHRVQA